MKAKPTRELGLGTPIFRAGNFHFLEMKLEISTQLPIMAEFKATVPNFQRLSPAGVRPDSGPLQRSDPSIIRSKRSIIEN